MVRTGIAALAVALMVAVVGPALADGLGPRHQKKTAAAVHKEAVATTQQYGQTGDITLANGGLKLFVPANYYFLPAADARAHLQRIGAQAPSGEVLGMVAPAGSRPIDDGFWGAVISVNPLGHVAEERADRLTAPDFVDEVRGARAAPAPRLEAFAAPPANDTARHVTSWTERYPAGAPTARTVRNEQRLLGRNKVAGVTIDARPEQLPTINAAAPEIARMVSFPAGQGYADFVPASDAAPLYDLPSLLTLKPRPTVETAALPAPPPTPAPTAPAATSGGIPAQSSGLQPVSDAAQKTAPASAFTAADVQKWLPWLGGGLVALAIIPWLVGLARRRGSGISVRENRDAPPRDRPRDGGGHADNIIPPNG